MQRPYLNATGTQDLRPPPDGGWSEGGISAEIRDLLAHLKRRRGVIVLAALLMGLAGIVIAGRLPRLYTATSQIMVDPRGLRVFDNEVVPAGQVSDVQSTIVETQSRILKSDSVLGPVVDRENLARDPEFNGEPRGALSQALRGVRGFVSGAQPPDPRRIALANLDDAVRVQRVPGSFVLEVGLRAGDAEKAARLARAVTEVFIANQEHSRQDAAKRVSDGLSLRLDELAREVNGAEKAVDAFKRQNNIVDTNGQPVSEQQLGNLSNQLIAARVRTGELKARYEQIGQIQRAGIVPDATAEAVQSPAIGQLRARYAEAKQAEDNLVATLGPRHPSLVAARAQTQSVRRLVLEEVSRLASSARSDYERARANEEGLVRQVEATTREAGTVNTAGIRLRELEREAQARRAVYESFLTRSRETREQGDLPMTNIAVISAAVPPQKPGGIPAILVVAICAAFGASAGAVGTLIADHLRGRLVTARQFGIATGLPLLSGTTRARGVDLARLSLAVTDIAPHLPPRVVLFLSAGPRAACAAVPLELAREMARRGIHLLLADADEDRQTRVLESSAPDIQTWPGVRQTAIDNLSVMRADAPALRGEGPGPAGAFARIAGEHDFAFVHVSLDAPPAEAGLRLRDLAALATTIVVLVDARAASTVNAQDIRAELGPFATRVGGFAWIEGISPADPRPAMPARSRRPARAAITASDAA